MAGRLAAAMGRLGRAIGGLRWAVQYRPMVARSIIWFVLGGLCFGLAAWMTNTIAHVTGVLAADGPEAIQNRDASQYVFSVAAAPGTTANAFVTFDLTTADETAVLTFALPEGSRAIHIRDLMPGGCTYVPAFDVRQPLTEIRNDLVFASVDVSTLDLSPGSFIDCGVLHHALEESFTTKVSMFRNSTPQSMREAGAGVIALPIELLVYNREGPSDLVAALHAGITDVPVILPFGLAVYRFHSIHAEQARDWYIVLIGTLIGFGAAMCIEALRPAIERIGRRRA